MPDAHRPASVDVNLLRSMRQAESSPFEQAMIWLANASVAFLVVAVLFFTILSKLPDRPRRKPAAAPAAPAAAKGERRKDGVYTAAQVAQHNTVVRAATRQPGGGPSGLARAPDWSPGAERQQGAPRVSTPSQPSAWATPLCACPQTDLWVIIKGKVYDVTSYVDEHPGGDAILRNAGCASAEHRALPPRTAQASSCVPDSQLARVCRRDSTEGFYGPQHPSRVFQILDDFLVGELAKESDKDK